MLDKNLVLFWNEVEKDLYEENGYIFGIELDLFNNHQNYYCKSIQNGQEYYQIFDNNIYKAIEKFNELIK